MLRSAPASGQLSQHAIRSVGESKRLPAAGVLLSGSPARFADELPARIESPYCNDSEGRSD